MTLLVNNTAMAYPDRSSDNQYRNRFRKKVPEIFFWVFSRYRFAGAGPPVTGTNKRDETHVP